VIQDLAGGGPGDRWYTIPRGGQLGVSRGGKRGTKEKRSRARVFRGGMDTQFELWGRIRDMAYGLKLGSVKKKKKGEKTEGCDKKEQGLDWREEDV